MKNYLYWRDTVAATICGFIFYFIAKIVIAHIFPFNQGALSPTAQAFQRFDFNDFVYSKFQDSRKTNDFNTDIVLVNIGKMEREGIAQTLDLVAKQEAKVVGLDVVFNSGRENNNQHLKESLAKLSGKLVVGTSFVYDSLSNIQGLVTSDSIYQHIGKLSYSNFVSESSQDVIRFFSPNTEFKNTKINAFATEIVSLAQPEAKKKLLQRAKKIERINYRYTANDFLNFDASTLLADTAQAKLLNGKIVLIGYWGYNKNLHDFEDFHYTPLNKDANQPDMSGICIHANIIAMVLDEAYINDVPNFETYIISFIVSLLHMFVYVKYKKQMKIWFHTFFKAIQFVSSFLVLVLSFCIFVYFSQRLQIEPIFGPVLFSLDVYYIYEAIAKELHRRFDYRTSIQTV